MNAIFPDNARGRQQRQTALRIQRRLGKHTGLKVTLLDVSAYSNGVVYGWIFQLETATHFKCGIVRITKYANGRIEAGSVTQQVLDGLNDVDFNA